MKLLLWTIGKANENYVKDGIADFTKRISIYFPVVLHIISTPKNAALLTETALKKKAGEIVLQLLKPDDFLIALDERGKQINSVQLAQLVQQRATESTKNVVFLIGGAFGLDDLVLKRANYKWSLSQLTFPHQLVRLILAEQLYRACSILRNEKYHHR